MMQWVTDFVSVFVSVKPGICYMYMIVFAVKVHFTANVYIKVMDGRNKMHIGLVLRTCVIEGPTNVCILAHTLYMPQHYQHAN